MAYWGDRNRGSDCMKAGGSGRSARIHDLTNCTTSLVTQWHYNCAGSLLLMVSSLLPFVASACSKGWFRKATAKWTSCWDVLGCAGMLCSWLSAVLPYGWMHFPVTVLGRLGRLLFQIKVYSGIYWDCSVSLCFLTYLLLTQVSWTWSELGQLIYIYGLFK